MLFLIKEVLLTVLHFLKADWHILSIGILIAVAINVYADPVKLRSLLSRRAGLSIPGSVLFGALTPLCACGTMAVLISMFVSALPWGAVMAFLVSSPLSSPSEFMFETAFLGTPFAIAMLISSVVLGISAGFVAHYLERKTSFFRGQSRLSTTKESSCCGTEATTQAASITEASSECCGAPAIAATAAGSCGCSNTKPLAERLKFREFGKQFFELGIKRILFYFVLFIAIGRVVEMHIPTHLITTLFSGDNAYSIPLSATIGLPLYVSNAAALPLLRSLLNAGAGQGAILAFLIAGKATGIPVIIGMSTFLKPRAIAFYVGFIYFGAIICGYVFSMFVR